MRTLRFLFTSIFISFLMESLAFANSSGEAKFIVEFYQKNQSKPQQTVELKESEKEKKFQRQPDHAECSLRIGEVTPLVSSYRKVEMEVECQEPYSKVSTSVTCLFSAPDAPKAKLIEKKAKIKGMQVDLGPLPEGVEVKQTPHHKSHKRAVTQLTPAWDSTGCQNLGEGLESMGGDKPQSRIKCCYSP